MWWRAPEWLVTGRSSGVSPGPAAPTPAREPVSPARRRLVGDVKVVAAPLRDLGAARMLTDALSNIDGVESISVTGIDQHDVHFEGWFGHQRELVAELERALPFSFEVESASGTELGLRVSAG